MNTKIKCDRDCPNVNCVGGVITHDGSTGRLCKKCNPNSTKLKK